MLVFANKVEVSQKKSRRRSSCDALTDDAPAENGQLLHGAPAVSGCGWRRGAACAHPGGLLVVAPHIHFERALCHTHFERAYRPRQRCTRHRRVEAPIFFHSGPFAPYYSQQSPRYRYARDNTTKQMFATTRNNPDRSLVEARRHERDAAPVPNPLLPWERANVRQSAESEADTQPYRAKDSAFCRRPNDEPVPGSQKLSRRAGHL